MADAGRAGMRSLARSITWSYWWRRLVSLALLNALLFGALVVCFVGYGHNRAAAEGLGEGHLALRSSPQVLERVVYDIPLDDAGEHRSYSLGEYATGLWPLAVVALCAETASLVALPLSTRRVRRKLQPLNDLAVAAERLGNEARGDLHKIESLEQAIHSASVESPHVSTGDKDLRSIEVALNGLLRQMQEAKLQQMRFVSDASHELRTPIAVIQGYVNMLDRWGKTDEAVLEESIEALKMESEHMQELVEQLLFLARGDSGRNTLERTRINLAEAAREVWEESCMIDTSHLYTLDVAGSDTHDDRFAMLGDVAMVKQSLRIIVQNAAAYSPAGTEVALSLRSDGREVLCRVQDEGLGISDRDASHIFERFYRAEAAREERSGGTGLGLSIAKWIVDAHEGAIEVLSREGVGTRFTLRFPRA